MASEMKVVKFSDESLSALKDLTAAIKISNQVNQSFIDEFLAALKLENVSLMEGGEFEEVEPTPKEPNEL